MNFQGAALKVSGEQLGKFRGNWTSWFSYICNTTITTVEQFYQCVNTHLYQQEEMIKTTVSFSFETTLVKNLSTEWKVFIESMFHGRCFTARNLGTLDESDNFKVMLNGSQPIRYV